MLNRWTSVLSLVLLAGCAANAPSGERYLNDLRNTDYLRTERTLEMTFPQIQMALFHHARVCGDGPVFRMKADEVSFATILEADSTARPWNEQIVFDLMWLQPSIRYETRTRVQVYSFFSDAAVKQRIATVFKAILEPDTCPGAD